MKKLLVFILLASVVSCKETRKSKGKVNEAEVDTVQPIAPEKKVMKDDRLVVPGRKLGNITLEETPNVVMKTYGKPDKGDAAMGKAVSTWEVQGTDGNYTLSIFTSRKMGVESFSRIKQIRTTAPDYKTEQGLGVGSSLDAIQKHIQVKLIGSFTENEERFQLYDSPTGIAFEIDNHANCTGILLHLPGKKATETYLPFYEDFKGEEVN